MIVANTPAPAPTPAADVSAPTLPQAGTAQADSAPEDFMELLTQLVSASTTAANSQSATVNAEATKDSDEDVDPTDLAAFLAIAVPMQIDLPKDVAAQTGNAADAVEALLGTIVKTDGAGQNAAQMLSATLAATDEPDTKDKSDLQLNAPTVTFADALTTHRSAQGTTDSLNQQPINAPVGSPQWRDEIGARITMMIERGNHSASLKLSPEHLGPLEVRISVQNDQASVWFGAAHADTRAAIEHALPRLRELFASQGLSLADAGVFREPPRDQPKQSAFSGSSRGEGSLEGPTVQSVMIRRLGLVDAYA